MRDKLIELRGDRTLTDVAKELEITRQMLGAIESGNRTPSLDLARKIALFYGTTIDNIFFNEKSN